ncbi:uncharacterized protein SOCEGT47_044490 [Sorangium cellulosum]|uniref:Secreted protein n=1 Tax=Sorangium cellulosum TaxID=56 RepID=A0A4P2Q3P8_SORCE|nr:hypothetical protein [Sorangium cellulosum]AUX23919.1 uncharacterized protein SOCEGT47_044490 [Sorangium cellulosum]
MNRSYCYCTMFALAIAALALPRAAAADEPAELAAPKQEYVDTPTGSDGRRQGLDWQLSSGATISFTNNASVVGQPDGSTLILGIKLDGLFSYNHAEHEWRNTVALGAGVARTPLIDELVKSRDALNVESIYLYHLIPTLGPFARLVLETTVFRGADVRPEPATYLIQRRDGTTDTRAGDRLALTSPFQPLMLKQSLGAFYRPVTQDAVNVELRAGAGGRETIARGELAISDDASTPTIEVSELDNVYQLGAEATAEAWGALSEKRVLYRASAEAMIPIARSALPPGDDRGALELTNIALVGALSFKLVEWASLDYELRAVREPQLIDRFQVQNNLLLTFGVSTGNLPPAK